MKFMFINENSELFPNSLTKTQLKHDKNKNIELFWDQIKPNTSLKTRVLLNLYHLYSCIKKSNPVELM